jgi:hypothetical protein
MIIDENEEKRIKTKLITFKRIKIKLDARKTMKGKIYSLVRRRKRKIE